MGKVHEFEANGRKFTLRMTERLGDREYHWTAEVELNGKSIGTVSGRTRRETIPVGSWDEGTLHAMAYFEAQEAVKRREGVSW
ncbi:hypothetical protein SAMN02800692_2039 [Luteibacter sp. UNC138MFCol5.1]|uniref:hypothetical protein n=1 Tax=Luteibacter sp. UNC138MFCol5.1 TaxID=1502774 RepID=UPI0008C464FC|nr:hypothetical protein [Luteibacter sp. UNC138MFCol5.1]SEO77086.1 hypothetical protein SAMN02800692_2039 [Luteibacter sp. UNC138MFCol5.1]